MTNNPDKYRIDVLIVTYNSKKYISELIKSLKKSKITNKILIYDNHSTDNTSDILAKKRSSRVNVVLGKKNIGFGNAMNILAKKAKSDYILLLNPDTKVREADIQKLVDCAVMHKSEITGGIMITESGRKQISYAQTPTFGTVIFEFTNFGKIFPNNMWHSKFHSLDSTNTTPHEVGSISGGYMLITRRAIKNLNGFDPAFFMYLEDVDLCKRAREQGYKVLVCPASKITHIGGASSTNRHKIHYEAWDKARIHYVQKHFRPPMSWILVLIIILDIIISKHKREN